MTIKDKVALGTIAGITATVPQLILNTITVLIGFSKYYAFQLAAGIYIYKHLTIRFWGLIFGLAVWESMAAGLGIITVYFIYWTGKDYWWLKGMLISNTLMFIFIYGFFFGFEAPKIVPWDLETNWVLFIENLIFGVVCGYLAVRWGAVKIDKPNPIHKG